MRRIFLVILCLVAIACVKKGSSSEPTTPARFEAGERVLVNYKSAGYWFVGRIAKVEGASVAIAYLDGTSEVVLRDAVRGFDWSAGTPVQCNWKGAGWYSGKITSLQGDNVHIAYDDGDSEDTSLGFCRVGAGSGGMGGGYFSEGGGGGGAAEEPVAEEEAAPACLPDGAVTDSPSECCNSSRHKECEPGYSGCGFVCCLGTDC